MNLLMFSGNSLRNRDWIYEAKAEVGPMFDDVYLQDYRHWDSDAKWIKLDHELEVLGGAMAKIDQPYGVFAKSIGAVLALQAIEKDILKPRFLLMLGLPLDYITDSFGQFKDVLAGVDCPVSVIHNTNDKVGTAKAVKDYLGHDIMAKIRWNTPRADTHNYEDYQLLRAELVALTK